ncbi:oxalate/formate antiporter family transporter [Bordetella ansorpii]|uniref:Oxalate/formate antiporter family transporter n=1 Tax=Bordetella ansorpii TaxID=288768 RepID=A0A157QVQ7_9BORD|nr:MFS transporter [Bordetella ansorpii]SAI49767.1 oxalate/formate antiporter family transporter [Bordetella ansorpii]
MFSPRAIVCIGLSQLLAWGVSFYLIGNFGPAMQAELGWSAAAVYGGMSGGIACMALVSPMAGRAIDRWGGRRVMPAGALLVALGCVLLACTHTLASYGVAWAVMGIGMRLTLYDAAFAALARAGGPQARRAMSQITLFGGLASTVMWPVGQALAGTLGWRGALGVYALLALVMMGLFRALPEGRWAPVANGTASSGSRTHATPEHPCLTQTLYAVIVMMASFLTAGNATHLIAMLRELGLAAPMAVSVAALWGVGQVTGRLAELLSGNRLTPVALNTLTALLLPLCFVAGLAGGYLAAAACFAFFYGVCNGLFTITRGTLPLVLFDPRAYGAIVGRLLVPALLMTAAGPLVYAEVIERWGARSAMLLSLACACLLLATSLGLAWRFGTRQGRAGKPAQGTP